MTTSDAGRSAATGAAASAARRGRAVWLAALAVIVHLLVLYWPVVTVEGPVSWTDKVVHLLVFAVPTYAVGRVTGAVRLTAAVFAVHAVVSELVQYTLLSARTGDPWDAVLDLVGVAAGVVALVVGARRSR